ncbi:MAG TPA: sugar ABC transporter permease [Oceanithermus profundus]|uniref:Sugar ABC transporter permease n=1 Tax=Oceanithermus profundus TaxID=187137 RepID=A0A7C4VBP7_9DEIN|nr:sugar ABC transporter permease [Oceanithermus profundus]
MRFPVGATYLIAGLFGLAAGVYAVRLLPPRALTRAGLAAFVLALLAGERLPLELAWLPLAGVFLAYAGSRAELPERAAAAFWGWVFVWPALALMLIWNIFPSFFALWISLFDRFNFIGASRFVGLLNYEILLRDPLFWRALANTFWYVALTVPTGILLGTVVAILLNERIRGLGFYRTVYFLPYITALTAAAAVWQWIYHPEFGFLNWLLGTPGLDWLHTPEGIFALALAPLGVELSGFWAGPSVAFTAIMIMTVWHFLGYNVVILLAGLQSIPAQYYEAAELDGASWWQMQRHITWPLLSPTTFFLAIIGLIGAFQVFTQVYVMTPTGGVLNDTLTVAMYLYNKGFRDSDFSYASALAVTMFVIILALTLIQRRVLERRVTYEH